MIVLTTETADWKKFPYEALSFADQEISPVTKQKEASVTEEKWTYVKGENSLVAKGLSLVSRVEAVYSSVNQELQTYTYEKLKATAVEESLTVKRISSTQFSISGEKNNKKSETIITKTKNLPWIQQLTIGFRHFILSKNQEMEYYFVSPPHGFNKSPNVMMMTAKKQEEYVVQKRIQVKVEFLKLKVSFGTALFDLETGTLIESTMAIGIRTQIKTTLKTPL